MTAIPATLANRYKLEEPIGEGSFASTYRATDTKLLRTVAVKILRAHHAADDGFSTRFEREAQAAAQVSHPNVVQVHDYGRDDEHMFIVMHYVSGPTLAEHIRSRDHLPVSEVVRIVSQILDGLAAIHAAGIVHRDIKPQNVLLEEDLTPRLGDFGVASSSQAMTLTQTGMTIGTAAYMAPEQATGEPAGPQADLYAVGVILYELLTGRLPFSGGNSVQVMYQHVNDPPPRPSEINPHIPPALEEVIMRALAKRPQARYPDAAAMRYALVNAGVETDEVFVVPPASYADQPTAVNRGTPPPSGPPPLARRGEPARWPFALASLIVALAIIALLAATMGGGPLFAGNGGDDNAESTATLETAAADSEPGETETVLEPTPTIPPTEAPEPPTPTATPEPPPTETPVPPPTETPVLPPTETPVPEPEPTEPPPSRAVDEFNQDVTMNSPFNPERIPVEILEGPVTVFDRDSLVEGGAYRRPDGVLYDMPAAHLYAQPTDHPSTTVSFHLDEAPDEYAVIRILGMDDESPATVPMQISVNGYDVHSGPNPFGQEVWTDTAWRIGDLGALQAGQNTITIANLAPEGVFGRPPWILISVVQVYVD